MMSAADLAAFSNSCGLEPGHGELGAVEARRALLDDREAHSWLSLRTVDGAASGWPRRTRRERVIPLDHRASRSD